MLKFLQAESISFKKILHKKGKSLFVIIPISIMVAIILFASSEAQNLLKVAKANIFSPIESQNEIIELNKEDTMNFRRAFDESEDTGYTSTDIDLISSIDNVEESTLLSEIPIKNNMTQDLFEGKTVYINNLVGLDSTYASLYSNGDFEYVEDSPIPIILNANDFYESYLDWQGKEEIEIEYSRNQTPEENEETISQSPIKTTAIKYDLNKLIGKEITIRFGSLDDISEVSQESTETGFKYVKKTDDTVLSEESARKEMLSKYWDYDKLTAPLSYKFVVVGISEGSDKTKTYVPVEFANILVNDYFNRTFEARNDVVIPTSEQNSLLTGVVYDGVTITEDTVSMMFAGIRNQVDTQISEQIDQVNESIDAQNKQINAVNSENREIMADIRKNTGMGPGGGTPPDMPSFRSVTSSISKLDSSSIKVSYAGMGTSYFIPGLLFSNDRTSDEITGEIKDNIFEGNYPFSTSSILIKISSVENRETVIEGLNNKGYNYQDFSQYEEFTKLESYLSTVLNGGSLAFMAFIGLFILISMAKFVSEGRKEIGIFRAIGATKFDILKLFMLQSLNYVILALFFGVIIGVGVVIAMSNYMSLEAQNFINTAVGGSIQINSIIEAKDFLSFDLAKIMIYFGGIILTTLIVAIIPSSQASKVSPVEAIRSS